MRPDSLFDRHRTMSLLIAIASAFLAAPSSAQCSLEKLLAEDLAAGDRFGNGVSIRGDLALVGSPYDETGDNNSGSAYVFRCVAGSWVQEQKLVPGDPESNDHFGEAVAIAGDIAVCGMEDDDDVMNGAGSAYVFRHNGSTWAFQQKIANPDPGVSEGFGWAVATNGAKLAISCKQDDALLASAGSVYVYREQGASWVLEKKLVASDAADFDWFGRSVAIEGSLIAGDAGPLGAAGQKSASLTLPGGLPPSLAGATLHHAFLLFDFGSFTVSQTSNASATAFTP